MIRGILWGLIATPLILLASWALAIRGVFAGDTRREISHGGGARNAGGRVEGVGVNILFFPAGFHEASSAEVFLLVEEGGAGLPSPPWESVEAGDPAHSAPEGPI